MTIKEVEQLTGLARSHIRFYEKEKLICPTRNAGNGYREYSEQDVKDIKKIAYLRTLGISVEEIRRLQDREADLYDVIKHQQKALEQQVAELEHARQMCERMLAADEKVTYEALDVEQYVEQYVTDLKEYWAENRESLRMDSVRFFYIWGGETVWGILTAVCLLTALLSIGRLPAEIPVQWAGGEAISFMAKGWIFAFPAACVLIRFLLRPFIWQWLREHLAESEEITNYVTNSLCLVALSIEIFIILYVNGIVRNITVILLIDTAMLLGILFFALRRRDGRDSGENDADNDL